MNREAYLNLNWEDEKLEGGRFANIGFVGRVGRAAVARREDSFVPIFHRRTIVGEQEAGLVLQCTCRFIYVT